MKWISIFGPRRTNVIIEKDSIAKYMPQYRRNINKAARKLNRELEQGDTVVLSAVSPQTIYLKIKKPDGTIITTNDIDSRELNAMGHKITKEDNFYNTLGLVPEDEQKLINSEYENSLKLILKKPFDHVKGIIDAYKKAVYKRIAA